MHLPGGAAPGPGGQELYGLFGQPDLTFLQPGADGGQGGQFAPGPGYGADYAPPTTQYYMDPAYQAYDYSQGMATSMTSLPPSAPAVAPAPTAMPPATMAPSSASLAGDLSLGGGVPMIAGMSTDYNSFYGGRDGGADQFAPQWPQTSASTTMADVAPAVSAPMAVPMQSTLSAPAGPVAATDAEAKTGMKRSVSTEGAKKKLKTESDEPPAEAVAALAAAAPPAQSDLPPIMSEADPANAVRMRMATAFKTQTGDVHGLAAKLGELILSIPEEGWAPTAPFDLRNVFISQLLALAGSNAELWKLIGTDLKVVARLRNWLYGYCRSKNIEKSKELLIGISKLSPSLETLDLVKMDKLLLMIAKKGSESCKKLAGQILLKAKDVSKAGAKRRKSESASPAPSTPPPAAGRPTPASAAAKAAPLAKKPVPAPAVAKPSAGPAAAAARPAAPAPRQLADVLSAAAAARATAAAGAGTPATAAAAPPEKAPVSNSTFFKSLQRKPAPKPAEKPRPPPAAKPHAPAPRISSLFSALRPNAPEDKPAEKPVAEPAAPKPAARKKRKTVTWKIDSELCQVKLFESSPEERAKPATPHEFGNARDLDISEGRAAFGKIHDDEDLEEIEWYTPTDINFEETAEYPKKSWERNYAKRGGRRPPVSDEAAKQATRKSSVLIAMYPTAEDVPATPSEPERAEDVGNLAAADRDAKTIPLPESTRATLAMKQALGSEAKPTYNAGAGNDLLSAALTQLYTGTAQPAWSQEQTLASLLTATAGAQGGQQAIDLNAIAAMAAGLGGYGR
ncbi:uncharacterized protein V1510DRAFT_429429 [Dipodascopsis tothii]|uniref:uncharacterized protein n=1 Tax=Dipodascopsis tothii TaxID=44089 RepID=UPI0034CFE06D